MPDTHIALLGFLIGYLGIGEVVLSRIYFGHFFYLTKRTFGWRP